MVSEYLLTLNDQDLNIISTALVKLPYEVVGPVIAKVDAQLRRLGAEAQSAADTTANEEAELRRLGLEAKAVLQAKEPVAEDSSGGAAE